MAWSTEWNKVCSVENCNEPIRSKGLCSTHYQRMYVQGRTHRVKQSREGTCSVENCELPIKGIGFCSKHFQLYKKYGSTDKLIRNRTRHPHYHLWFERKTNNLLCEEWLDFLEFVKGVGDRPEGNYLLLQIDGTKPFGPYNFRWQEHLKRKEDESKTDWWARKRAARIAANPAMESNRNIKRKYNLTRDQYDEKLKNQNYVCAICEEKETAFDGRSGSFKNLAVDHCHKTNKIRDLLCWRCNATIGKINEDIELLKKMINYLEKHKA